MARAYSHTLREKVMTFVNQGGSKREASRVYNIGENTIYRWIRRFKAGNLKPKERTDFPRKVPIETLRNYVKENPDHALKEIGLALGLS
jgi:putative transposase